MNLAFSDVEKLSFVAGQSDPDMFCQYIPRLREYLNPDTGDFDGALLEDRPSVQRAVGGRIIQVFGRG